eukprot:CAMPEP_0119308972 /NCGR_PEP_ID=MMETSP1333-20130426/13245_1 /TAXON_ID=418940 /ORGANISM="Scyphosphaera apsteinii, Strain RCC1455" /LENGTH=108 /DNA_ID=CAMNT_0007312867 /DNA_START=45 /DNA_END=371 /DNA_ORIENTATION=+
MLSLMTIVAGWSLMGSAGSNVPRRMAAVRAEQRWKDPIFDESLPDPVFDDDYQYKGFSSYGFVATAETWNGRAAMMGFTILFLQELIFGKGVLELYGLPYDAGAVLQQ